MVGTAPRRPGRVTRRARVLVTGLLGLPLLAILVALGPWAEAAPGAGCVPHQGTTADWCLSSLNHTGYPNDKQVRFTKSSDAYTVTCDTWDSASIRTTLYRVEPDPAVTPILLSSNIATGSFSGRLYADGAPGQTFIVRTELLSDNVNAHCSLAPTR